MLPETSFVFPLIEIRKIMSMSCLCPLNNFSEDMVSLPALKVFLHNMCSLVRCCRRFYSHNPKF